MTQFIAKMIMKLSTENIGIDDMKKITFYAIVFLQFVITAITCLVDYNFFRGLDYNEYISCFLLAYLIRTWPQPLILVLMALKIISRRLVLINLIILDAVLFLFYLFVIPEPLANALSWIFIYPWLVLFAFLMSLYIKKAFYTSELEFIEERVMTITNNLRLMKTAKEIN